MTDGRSPRALTCEEVRDLAAPFVLDALEQDDAEAVRTHLATCPEAHEEMTELAGAVPVLAASVAQVEPSPALKGRIMAAAAADFGGARAEPLVVAPPAPTAPATLRPIDRPPERSRRSVGSWVLGLAAVLAIALLGGWNLLLQTQLGDARAYEQGVAAVLDVAAQPGAVTAVLSGEGEEAPSGLAAIAADGSVTLAMQRLPATQGEEVYEAWSIVGDAAPMPLGSFRVGGSGVASFEGAGATAQPGVVLALTREHGPGATMPTLPIVSSGAATSGASA
jgi:anti-sigma factor RsiW